ncbi:MAG: NADH-quinone oxidoreductase subunit C [Alphaproteobacteria bacterium]|uniref:NADH-quinone oxidoreductase subunit C n=1 Tax=Hyphomonas sp. TaxID=87 RepID=UPI001D33070C|nr:NADH-quinone oxidoreductase subunit C [Alphaproteobacteria bacterium]MBU2085598.1 NADH-quinone oxidoreductase subunit C [Alphaproteobacteria bacterium]MBU2141836.1 NADH-quinone oxidoreductase subunit C [Alphaproteobacteria bacterium]MBU2195792.1 NADH-quinone oxidoreductase subunit C [Alphaproteobacteria bacterium]
MSIEALKDLAAHIEATQGDAVRASQIVVGELTLLAERDHIVRLLRFLRDDQQCNFETLVDICGVDYPERSDRFEVVYHLLSMRMNHRIRVRIRTDEETPVPSATVLWPAANWFEREAFDMYGIQFADHPDLRRILTDYGFEGYPLRKDFPLTGHYEVRYDDLEKRVVYEPVKLTQEYRNFDFLSPWEGMTSQIPGDEKAVSEEAPE